jgi:L-threonylcarbamoyladenylate synthase
MLKTRVIKINPQAPEAKKIKQAAQALKKGKLVVIPTETVYGIGANLGNQETMQRLSTLKQRAADKPFSLHIATKEEAEKYAQDILPFAYRLMEKFWPGPLTLVLKSKENGKVGLRMPDHQVSLAIIQQASVAIVCPSANLAGKPAPSTVEEVLKDLNGQVDLIVDMGKTALGKESTVVDVTQLPLKILRAGAISLAEIEKVANKKTILFVCTGNSCRSVMAKGLLDKKLKEKNRDDVQVLSAGIMLLEGLGPAQETKELLAKEGIDISSHYAQKITASLIKQSDLVLAMEKMHEERILELVAEAKNRLFLLKEFAKMKDNELDIADPIGKPMEFYEKTFGIIKEAVEKVAEII